MGQSTPIPAGFPQKLAEIVSKFGAYDYKNDPRDKDFEFHVRFSNGEKCQKALAEHSISCDVYFAVSGDMGDVMFLVDRTVFNQDAQVIIK